MDRGAWRATVHGIARVGHNLAPSFFLSSFSCFVEYPHSGFVCVALVLALGLHVERRPQRASVLLSCPIKGTCYLVIYVMDPCWLTSCLSAPLKALLSVLHPLQRSHSRQSRRGMGSESCPASLVGIRGRGHLHTLLGTLLFMCQTF